MDKHWKKFHKYVLEVLLNNGERFSHDWLVWSRTQEALYCFPCRLFSKFPEDHRHQSIFSSKEGWMPTNRSYKKLYSRIPDHENIFSHIKNYVAWRNLEKNIDKNGTIKTLIFQ